MCCIYNSQHVLFTSVFRVDVYSFGYILCYSELVIGTETN